MAVFSMKLIVLALSCASSAATNMKDIKLQGKECLVPTFYEEYEVTAGKFRVTTDSVPGQLKFPEFFEVSYGPEAFSVFANQDLDDAGRSGHYSVASDLDIDGSDVVFYECVHKRSGSKSHVTYEGLCTSTLNDGGEGPIYTQVLDVDQETCMVEGYATSGRGLAGGNTDVVLTFVSEHKAVKHGKEKHAGKYKE
mmetsp:Transcript_83347/g.162187  ORF Transcript_83347/g.162187 Transcript_83347/m.162187 type:complete len:195 (+) Transcript_83347:923-1507(+)